MNATNYIFGFTSWEAIILWAIIVLFIGGIVGFKIARGFACLMNQTKNPGGNWVDRKNSQ